MNPEEIQYLKQWLVKAKEDKIAVEKLTETTVFAPSVVCFHCQQMAEKYLKAFLLYHGKEIMKTHDIEYLLAECGEIDPAFNVIDPKNLSDFGVSIRYPDELYIPSDEETFEYKSIAFNIEKLVLSSIKI
jgi:HEPN domain-containing protein